MIFLIFWFIIIRKILHISFKLYKFYNRNTSLRKFINRILSLRAQFFFLAILCSTCHVVIVIVFIFIIYNQTFFQYPLQLLWQTFWRLYWPLSECWLFRYFEIYTGAIFITDSTKEICFSLGYYWTELACYLLY